jgi:hypothetical protein
MQKGCTSPADFHHVFELDRLAGKSRTQVAHGTQEFHGAIYGRDFQGSRIYVIGGLAEVHIAIGMQRCVVAFGASEVM